MKKIITAVVSLLVAASVHASTNWTFVATNQGRSDFFIDKNSIQKNGDSFTFWLRVNYNQRQSSNALSVKMKDTVNCRKRESASEYMMAYDDIDNKGNLVGSFEVETSWKPIKPDSINWELMNFVCK